MAALVAREGGDVDRALFQAAADLRAQGLRLAGALQHPLTAGDCRCAMMLEDLSSGQVTDIAQNLGPGAKGCGLNTGALETAVGLVLARLEAPGQRLDAVFINRFGKREADGHGFRQVVIAALSANVPVVIGVAETMASQFASFTGGEHHTLPADPQAIAAFVLAHTPEVVD